jgi:hypothetical protein
MTEDGNIRVKDSYCDSKEVSETYFQRQLHIFMVLLFSDSADEQILLDLIDSVMDGIMKAEAIASKKCARLASMALLASKRSRSSPPPKTKVSAGGGSPRQKKLKSERKSMTAETQLSAVLWVNTNRPASKHRDWYPLLVAYWMSAYWMRIIFAEILSGKPKSISLMGEHDKMIFARDCMYYVTYSFPHFFPAHYKQHEACFAKETR